MDKINILNKDNFPLYAEGVNIVQNAALTAAMCAQIGGNNYILSGCIEDSEHTSVSDGYIVVNGEILPFTGGAIKAKIKIVETKKTIHAFGVDYPESYVFRVAQFSDAGDINWSDLEKLPTNKDLYKQIKDITGDPVGIVKEWAGFIARIPKDYMLCDGRDLSVIEYPELYENIGTIYGGDGVNSFKIPDRRRRVSVGYSGDGDYNNQGNIGGSETVELDVDNLPAHDHTNGLYFNKLSARAADVDATNTPSGLDANTPDAEYRVGGMTAPQWAEATIKSVGDNVPHENRPPYIVQAHIIKVR